MEATLTQVIAPMGCYSGPGCIGGIQRSTQSFIHSSTHVPCAYERKALIRRVLTEDPKSKLLRAAIETHFSRTLSIREWHIKSDRVKDLQVEQFIENIRSSANKTLLGVETTECAV